MINKKEYELLKHQKEEGFNWIARDRYNDLYTYKIEPSRRNVTWESTICYNYIGSQLFTFIKWEDEKPTKIDDLIRDYESHQVIVGENLNKAELVKEIEDILYTIGIHSYRIDESCENYHNWGINSKTIREIFSAIEKYNSERMKVTIPQFVADWIEKCKPIYNLRRLFSTTHMPDSVKNWTSGDDNNCNLMALAWIYGYEIEKEKLYTVGLPNGPILIKDPEFNTFKLCKATKEQIEGYKYKLTQSEIEYVDPRLMEFAEEVE